MNLSTIYIPEESVISVAERIIATFHGFASDAEGVGVKVDPSKGSDFATPDRNQVYGDTNPEPKDCSKAFCLAARHAVQAFADTQRCDVKILPAEVPSINLHAIAEHYEDKYLLRCFE